MKKKYQVVIVGGGPVGAALALELGLRGVSCALIERTTELQRIPKGQNLTQRTLGTSISGALPTSCGPHASCHPTTPSAGSWPTKT